MTRSLTVVRLLQQISSTFLSQGARPDLRKVLSYFFYISAEWDLHIVLSVQLQYEIVAMILVIMQNSYCLSTDETTASKWLK